MAWSVPMTATANSIWFASQFNAFVRDNLRETMTGKATVAGGYFVSDQSKPNSITERSASAHEVLTSQTTTSTSYTNLSTIGPTLTMTTGTCAAVFYAVRMANGTVDSKAMASVTVSGASNIPADDNWAIMTDGVPAAEQNRSMGFNWFRNLRAGSNTFTVKYKVLSGTGTFVDRYMAVMPLS